MVRIALRVLGLLWGLLRSLRKVLACIGIVHAGNLVLQRCRNVVHYSGSFLLPIAGRALQLAASQHSHSPSSIANSLLIRIELWTTMERLSLASHFGRLDSARSVSPPLYKGPLLRAHQSIPSFSTWTGKCGIWNSRRTLKVRRPKALVSR